MQKTWMPPAGAAFLAILLLSCQTTRITTIRETIPVSGGEAPVTILQISDLHLNPANNIYGELTVLIADLKPDVLVITGDMVDKYTTLGFLREFLPVLDGIPHKFAITGNWEFATPVAVDQLTAEYASRGVVMLRNDYRDLTVNGVAIRIIGIDDLLLGSPEFRPEWIAPESLNVILIHCPALFHEIRPQLGDPPSARVVFMAGHTHGGQVTLFGLPLYLPPGSGGFNKGVYFRNDVPLYISGGVGNSNLNIRIFARRDVILYTLAPGQGAP
jgi:predicted MPP superfamily phosphohydrolase